ncbi:MAG: hypothetical protein HYY17_16580 [Planctomycetes bacterium]|nr:hypothetical protein [Planctomycetota bacterium]
MRVGWVVGTYFPVAGGFVLGIIFAIQLQAGSVAALCGLGAAAAFLGGYVAARASAGKTFWEPALGAALFVGSLVGMFMATTLGSILTTAVVAVEPKGMTKHLLITAGTFFGGALLGAFVGEKVQTVERGSHQIFMIVFSFFAVLGGIFITLFGFTMFVMEKTVRMVMDPKAAAGADAAQLAADTLRGTILALAFGSFLGGVVSRRAGARIGPIALGGVLTGGLFVALIHRAGSAAIAGIVFLTLGVIFCAVIGGLIGSIGLRPQAEVVPPAPGGPPPRM